MIEDNYSKSRLWYALFPGNFLADFYEFDDEIDEKEFKRRLKKRMGITYLPKRLEVWPTTKESREVIVKSQEDYVECALKSGLPLTRVDLVDQVTHP